MSLATEPENPISVKGAVSELLKRFGVFVLTPAFLFGMDKAFLSH